MGKNGSSLSRTTAVTPRTLHPRKAATRVRILAVEEYLVK